MLRLPLFRDSTDAVAPCVPHCHKDRNEEQSGCQRIGTDWIIKGHQDNDQANEDEYGPVAALTEW